MSATNKTKSFSLAGALAILGVLVIAVVGAASASAALPEFIVTGGKTTFTGKSKSGTTDVLETVKKEKVECKKDTSSGEIANGKAGAVKKVKVLFEECTGPVSSNCGNVTSKNIETEELEGSPEYATSSKSTVLLVLTAVKSRFAKFECVGLLGIKSKLEVRGKNSAEKEGVLGDIPAASLNKVLTKSELVFKQTSSGVQEFTSFWNGTSQVTGVNLETEAKGAISFAFEQSSQQNQDELTSVAGVELKA